MAIDVLVSLVFLLTLVLVLASIISGAPFVATNKKEVERIIKLSKVKRNQKVVDLGSGDGRILIAFAKKGINATGYEINPILVLWSRIRIRRLKLNDRAFVYWGSFWKKSLSEFDLVVVFGISYIMKRLEGKLFAELKKGAKIITHVYKLPSKKILKEKSAVYLYRV